MEKGRHGAPVPSELAPDGQLHAHEDERFRLMVEATEEVFFFEHDHEHRFTYLSPSVHQLLGYRREELLGKAYDDLLMGLAADAKVHDRTREALETGRRVGSYDAVVRHRSGHNVVLEVVETPVVREGVVVGLQGFARDVTRQRQSEDRLRHVASTSPAVLYTLGVDGTTVQATWVSGNVTEILGYSVEEALVPGWWRDHLHPGDRDAACATTDALLNREAIAHEYRFQHKDGKYRWIRDHLKLLRDDDGRPAEVVGSWMDTTEFRRLEQGLRHAQKMEAVGRLAGGISHDFNNMLTAIMGHAQFALDALPEGDRVRDDVEEVMRAAGRASGLTRQLLAFSRRQVSEPRILELGEVIGGAELMLRRLIGEDVRLDVSLAPDLGRIKADRAQLEQVLVNLVVNARDAMPEGGRVLIDARNVDLDDDPGHAFASPIPPGSYVRMAVSDTGSGMDPETRERIFEPFFTTKDASRGSGLGLSTVYGTVRQAGGHVLVHTEPGAGSTFQVYLPRTEDAGEPAPAAQVQPAELPGSETVLVVEDQTSVRRLVRRALEHAGYRVLDAANGSEALAVYHEAPEVIDLLLTDVVMPQMGGKELADRVRQVRPDLRILFMSGHAEQRIARRGVLEPGTHLLEKPFDPRTLQRKVREALDRDAP